LKVSQQLGAAPQPPAFVNLILLLEPPSKNNPGYTPKRNCDSTKIKPFQEAEDILGN